MLAAMARRQEAENMRRLMENRLMRLRHEITGAKRRVELAHSHQEAVARAQKSATVLASTRQAKRSNDGAVMKKVRQENRKKAKARQERGRAAERETEQKAKAAADRVRAERKQHETLLKQASEAEAKRRRAAAEHAKQEREKAQKRREA